MRSPLSKCFQPCTSPLAGDTTRVCAPASSRAFFGSVSSACSNPSAARMATFMPLNVAIAVASSYTLRLTGMTHPESADSVPPSPTDCMPARRKSGRRQSPSEDLIARCGRALDQLGHLFPSCSAERQPWRPHPLAAAAHDLLGELDRLHQIVFRVEVQQRHEPAIDPASTGQ